jgi:hypothetical protein
MTATVLLAMWGAIVSTGLAGIKIWETFYKDRLRLAKSYMLTGETGGEHEITVANLSSVPVQVSSWSVAYEPKLFRWKTKRIDVTPDWDKVSGFRIDGHSTHTLFFGGEDQFEWGWKIQQGRKLCLALYIFGRKRPKRLTIKSSI